MPITMPYKLLIILKFIVSISVSRVVYHMLLLNSMELLFKLIISAASFAAVYIVISIVQAREDNEYPIVGEFQTKR